MKDLPFTVRSLGKRFVTLLRLLRLLHFLFVVSTIE